MKGQSPDKLCDGGGDGGSPPVPGDGGSRSPASRVPCRSGGLFAIDQVHRPAGVILVLVGELDLAAVAWSGSELAQMAGNAGTVVADLRRLEFIDCAGIGALLKLEQRLRNAGGRLAVVPGGSAMRALFELVGLSNRLDLVEDPEEALALPAP